MSTYYTPPPQVIDGDVAYAKDVNDVNNEANTAFTLVEADIDALPATVAAYTELARKWAEEVEDTPVEPGQFSAFHWSSKSIESAEAAAASAASALAYTVAAGASEVAAGVSAAAALVSEGNASDSEVAAAASETAAGLSEVAAGLSEVAAGLSESNAADSETAAGLSEVAAALSETNAETAETNAATSETNAATSETNAGNSAAAAFSSQTESGLSEAAAAVSASEALASEIAAAASAASIELPDYSTGADQQPIVRNAAGDGWELGAKFNRKNYILNADFGLWQRTTTLSLDGFSADRWYHTRVNQDSTISRQIFTIGTTDSMNNSYYFLRSVISNTGGEFNYNRVLLSQKIENVVILSGRTVAISFWLRTDADQDIMIHMGQNFGSGGSTSVADISPTLVTNTGTNEWKKHTVVIDIPSVSGKTIGGGSYTTLNISFSAGSDWAGPGLQTGTFDISDVQVERGSKATEFEFRKPGKELALCQRYFQLLYFGIRFFDYDGQHTHGHGVQFVTNMREIPSSTLRSVGTVVNVSSVSCNPSSPQSARMDVLTLSPVADTYVLVRVYELDAEL